MTMREKTTDGMSEPKTPRLERIATVVALLFIAVAASAGLGYVAVSLLAIVFGHV